MRAIQRGPVTAGRFLSLSCCMRVALTEPRVVGSSRSSWRPKPNGLRRWTVNPAKRVRAPPVALMWYHRHHQLTPDAGHHVMNEHTMARR